MRTSRRRGARSATTLSVASQLQPPSGARGFVDKVQATCSSLVRPRRLIVHPKTSAIHGRGFFWPGSWPTRGEICRRNENFRRGGGRVHEVEVFLCAKLDSDAAETGLYDLGPGYVVMDRVDDKVSFQWFPRHW